MTRRSRRGNQAIEFALTLPILLALASGVVDLGQYLVLSDAVVASVSEGARAGAIQDTGLGGNPVATAQAVANTAWTASGQPGAFTVTSNLVSASPNTRIVVNGSVPFAPFFGFVPLPASITYQHTILLMVQN